MFKDISYFPILGFPLLGYLGILTLLSIFLTVSIPLMNRRGIRIIPFRYHPVCAACAVTLAIVHGTLGFLSYL